MKLSLNKKVSISNDNGEVILLNMNNGKFYGLDDIGTEVVQLIQNEIDYEQMMDELRNNYDVPSSQLEKDIYKFISDLIRFGLVETNE